MTKIHPLRPAIRHRTPAGSERGTDSARRATPSLTACARTVGGTAGARLLHVSGQIRACPDGTAFRGTRERGSGGHPAASVIFIGAPVRPDPKIDIATRAAK